MRILTVSPFFEGRGGGIEKVAAALASQFAAKGHRSVWAALGTCEDPLPGVTRLALAGREIGGGSVPLPLPTLSACAKVAEAVRAADAVVVHDALYATSLLTGLAASRRRSPWVVVQHVGAIPYRSRALRWTKAAADAVVTRPFLALAPSTAFISDTVRRELAPRSDASSALVFNGVDAATFTLPNSTQMKAARRRIGLGSEPAFLFVGRFVEKKGLDVIRHVAVMRPDARFLLAGEGPIDPSAWGLSNVQVLGRLQREGLVSAYHAADALVLPSTGEGYPLVVQEAMATGLPIVCGEGSAAADPEASRFLRGIPVDLTDPRGTAHRVADALQVLALARSADASAYARTTYRWETADRLLALLASQAPTLRHRTKFASAGRSDPPA